jgi:hypothetical protein
MKNQKLDEKSELIEKYEALIEKVGPSVVKCKLCSSDFYQHFGRFDEFQIEGVLSHYEGKHRALLTPQLAASLRRLIVLLQNERRRVELEAGKDFDYKMNWGGIHSNA